MAENPENPPSSRAPKRPDIVIRAPRLSDAEEINALVNLPGLRNGTLQLPYQSLEHTRKYLEEATGDGVNLVALLEGKIVASGGLTRFAGRRQHVASIGMGVHDEFTGQGIGRALLAAMIEAADDWLNVKRLELTVYADNDAAIRLYRQCGFEQEGLLRSFGFRAGRYVDAYAMGRVRA